MRVFSTYTYCKSHDSVQDADDPGSGVKQEPKLPVKDFSPGFEKRVQYFLFFFSLREKARESWSVPD